MTRAEEYLIWAIGGIEDKEVLEKIVRKANRTLKKIDDGTAPAANNEPTVDLKDLKAGDSVVIGTPRGQKTKCKISEVHRKRIRVELLEERGTRKKLEKGTEIDIYPDMIREHESLKSKDADQNAA